MKQKTKLKDYKVVKSHYKKKIKIPSDWIFEPLQSKINVLSGFAFNSQNFDKKNGIPLIRIRDLANINTQIHYNGDFSKEFLINTGDLLVGMDGEFCSHLWKGGDALLNQRVCKITTASEKILHQRFIYYTIKKELRHYELINVGTTVIHLSKSDIENISILFPTILEQQKIASILSGVDALIESTQHIIEKTERLKKSMMQKLLTRGIGHTKFKKTTLGGIAKFSSGEFLPAKNHNSGNVPIYGGNGITGYHDKELIKYNAIIFGRVGAYCGSVHLSNSKSWITDNAIFIKNLSNQITIAYLYRFLSRLNIRLLAEISAQPKISQDILNHIKIHFPEDLKEQQKIASILSGVDALRHHNIVALIILHIKLAIFLTLFVRILGSWIQQYRKKPTPLS